MHYVYALVSITVDEHEFERVEEFKYLSSSMVTQSNDATCEINQRLVIANRDCFALTKLLRSRILSYVTKITICKILIRPVLTYAETWP